ncbi:hypothetical protein SCARR_05372 [Pontiella sulfatireligans]|uniref:Uncharacterized protein n=2 Tax=Pontiella sulfatireligans TaxID=2750658 RepID=A0A6C2USH5_9BACT|nr:hypothetical protein SCARR_05372 [Pontiella sulfatireligans]
MQIGQQAAVSLNELMTSRKKEKVHESEKIQPLSMETRGSVSYDIGGILIATGMLSVVYVEKEQAEKMISAGLLTLVAGAGIALAGFAMTTAGVVAVVAGSGEATKATVMEILRRKIEKQMREKSISELIGISRQLNG